MIRVPKIRPGCDIRSLPLTPKDAFLLSRMDGTMSEHQLVGITGFGAEEVAAVLDRLAALDVIEFTSGSVSHTQLRTIRDPRALASPAVARPTPDRSPAPLPDDGLARRKGLARKLSGAYAMANGEALVNAPAPEADPRSLEPRGEPAANEASNPELGRSLGEGKRALAQDDFEGAIQAYRMASSLAPDDLRIQALCNNAVRRASAALANTYWERAVSEELQERWHDAALSYSRVCDGRPNYALAHERVANAALRSDNVRRAVEFARKAIVLEPGSVVFRITLTRAYVAAGLETSALGELERVIALAPNDARIVNFASRVRSHLRKNHKAG